MPAWRLARAAVRRGQSVANVCD
ncbi:hypothetical protein [Burkholderia cepacia]